MLRPAISTPCPLPRQRDEGADDKSPQTNLNSIDLNYVRTPAEIIVSDDAPLALRKFQIIEGEALAHHAKPEGSSMTTDTDQPTALDHLGRPLSPCPFCGGTDLEIANTHTASFWITCQDCDAEAHGGHVDGPRREDKFHYEACPDTSGFDATYGDLYPEYQQAFRAAVDAWNRRVTNLPDERRSGAAPAVCVDDDERAALNVEINVANVFADLYERFGSTFPRATPELLATMVATHYIREHAVLSGKLQVTLMALDGLKSATAVRTSKEMGA